MATLELLALHAQSVNNAGLFAELNHAVRLVILLGPAGILHLPSALKAFHQIV